MRALTLGLVLTGSILAAAGCATNEVTSGKPIPQSNVDQIVDGQTTADQVITMFGAPTSQSEIAGNILYVYRFSKTKSSAAFLPYVTQGHTNEAVDELTITFDKASGRVKAHSMQRGTNS